MMIRLPFLRSFAFALLPLALPVGEAGAASLSGSYLAGRHAEALSDVGAAAKYYTSALARDPDDVGLMEQALIFRAASGDVESALGMAERLEAASPGHRVAALILTASLLKKGDYPAALARLKEAPTAYHPLIAAMLTGWAAHGAGDDAAASAAFDVLGNQPSFRFFSGFHRGLMRHAAGDAAGAVAAYEAASAEVSSATGRMALAYGAALRDLGRAEEARAIYAAGGSIFANPALQRALDELEAGAPVKVMVATPAEGAAEALYGLAAALGRDGDEKLSLFYSRIAGYLRPGFDEASLLSAELLASEMRYRLAIEAYETIEPGAPLHRSAAIGRANALQNLDETAAAAEALRSLVTREPDAIDGHIALGDLMRRSEKFPEAAEAYDAAIILMEAAGNENWVLYYQRGIARERSNLWDGAEADFFKALELQPDHPLVLNYLGYSWLEKGLNLDRALEMIRKAVDQRPQDGYIVDSLGWAHYLRAEYPQAVEHLERAVELRPIDPVINDHFGDALWRVGRKREAAFQWRRALSFDPEEKDLTRIKRKLDLGLDIVLEEDAARAAARNDKADAANDG